MTLRDFGEWISGVWDGVLSDLGVVATSGPLDWPIWTILTLVFIVAPGFLAFLGYLVADHHRNAGPATIKSLIGTGMLALLTTMVTLDAYFTLMIFDGPPKFIFFLRLCYPFMSSIFILSFILVLQDWKRQRKQ